MVTEVVIDQRTGRALGVHYLRDGRERFQRARMVAVAGYSIETPRLLLNSASNRFPDGLCNEFDQVGRYLMVQGAPQTAGRFDAEVRMYKAPPPEVSSEAFYETDPARDYKRGFAIQTVSPLPITWAEHVAAQGHWGRALREYMSDYVHWSCLGSLCEFLALPENRVTLADEKDAHGLPVAQFAYSQCDNDRALIKAGADRHGGHPARGRARTRSSRSTATPTSSAARGWPPTNGTGSSTGTAAASPCPTCTSPTAACSPPRAAPTRR